jgi:hypothetical protein
LDVVVSWLCYWHYIGCFLSWLVNMIYYTLMLLICLVIFDLCVVWLVAKSAMNVPEKMTELEFTVAAMVMLMTAIVINFLTIGTIVW